MKAARDVCWSFLKAQANCSGDHMRHDIIWNDSKVFGITPFMIQRGKEAISVDFYIWHEDLFYLTVNIIQTSMFITANFTPCTGILFLYFLQVFFQLLHCDQM